MGEAYDRTGAFLGAVEADTKLEVFDKLNLKFKDAAEIRIRVLETTAQIVDGPNVPGNGIAMVIPANTRYALFHVDRAYPQAGRYFVVYEDGYQSYSPAQAFEAEHEP